MPDAPDMDLVREFARDGSEAAFAEIVRRRIDLVYSVALRFMGSPADAQDVAQAVFIILARKAARLSERTVLTGWLYETTRFTAARALSTQARRRAREQDAAMESTLTEADTDSAWRQLAPHLEAAVARLGTADRTLLALRFYENKTGSEAAAALGISADAAHKRTARALEKLRGYFAKRGIAVSAVAIAGAVSANAVQAAPVGLAATVTATAAKGTAIAATTTALVKGALELMAWTKAKAAIAVAAGVLLAAGTTTVLLEGRGLVATSGSREDNLKAAWEVLHIAAAETRAKLVPNLTNEFEVSLAARTNLILQEVSQNLVAEYKTAMIAKRVIELGEHVVTLPYREIPVDARQRDTARQQYSAILDRYEGAATDKTVSLGEVSGTTVVEALRQGLQNAQQDVFRAGYGQPMNAAEIGKLNQIADGMLDAIAGVPKAAGNKGGSTTGLREASKIANDGNRAVLQCLRDREARVLGSVSFIVVLTKWKTEISALEKSIDRNLEESGRAEVDATTERARQQAERDIWENDPKRIEAEAKAAQRVK